MTRDDDETVRGALRLMRRHGVGEAIVAEERAAPSPPIGVISLGDLVDVLAPPMADRSRLCSGSGAEVRVRALGDTARSDAEWADALALANASAAPCCPAARRSGSMPSASPAGAR